MFDIKDFKRIVGKFSFTPSANVDYKSVKKNGKKATLSNDSHSLTLHSDDYVEINNSKLTAVRTPRYGSEKILSATKIQGSENKKLREKTSKRIDEDFMKSEKYLSGKAVLAGFDRNKKSNEIAYLEEPPPLRNENGELIEEMDLRSYRDVVRNRMPPQDYDI